MGWSSVVRQAPGSAAEAWDRIITDPRRTTQRQHQLRGALKTGTYRGAVLDQWQYEVTGAGWLWCLVDDERQTLWLVHAGTVHRNATERRKQGPTDRQWVTTEPPGHGGGHESGHRTPVDGLGRS